MQDDLDKPLSPYKGVCYDRLKGRWKARTLVNGKRISAGYHDTPEQAYKAVQKAQHQAIVDEAEAKRRDDMNAPWPEPDIDQTKVIPAQVRRHSPSLINKSQEFRRKIATAVRLKRVSIEELPVPDNYREIVARNQRVTTVAQHNSLIETPNTSTLLEARIFCLMLRTIRKGDTEVPTAVIPLQELFPTFGGQQYRLLEAAMRRMMSATLQIPEPNEEDVHLVSLCDSMRYDSATKMLVATFGKAVTPYLVNLAGNFALADVDELLAIKSNSSHRLYWLMRAWQFKSPHTISVERLKELTADSDHYKEYSDFRRKVLKPSVAELNELSFDITFIERRQRGRPVTDITFNINKKSKVEQLTLPLQESLVEVVTSLPHSSLQQKVQTRLQKLKLTEAQIRKVQQALGGDETQLKKLMQETHPILINFETKAKPGENVAAATMALLKSTFPQIWRAK